MLDPDQILDELFAQAQSAPDNLVGWCDTGDLIKKLQAAVERLADLRRAYGRGLLGQNYTFEEIAQASGMTRSRAEAIINK
jgi:hypothetical protein